MKGLKIVFGALIMLVVALSHQAVANDLVPKRESEFAKE